MSVEKNDIDRLYERGALCQLDIHFVRFLTGLAGRDDAELTLAAALVSSYTGCGHVCLDLACVEGMELLPKDQDGDRVVSPGLSVWTKKLRSSPVVGTCGEYRPLILDDSARLYLYRYWDYQEKLANLIRCRVTCGSKCVDLDLLKEGLTRLFPCRTEKIDWQKVAAFTALTRNFSVISGGPGTGKTTTVAGILALLLEQAGPKRLRIVLVAPTGKAAARLQEAIKHAKEHIDCTEAIKKAIPEEASTIHRLLGTVHGSPYFRHDYKNPLLVDVVVVDEASMVDLALMSKLVQALPVNACIILFGDKDQLASVEAGAVLGDICDTGNMHGLSVGFCRDLKKVAGYEMDQHLKREDETGIHDCLVQLQKSYRFGSDSGIGAVSRAVNKGDSDRAVTLLADNRYQDISWKDLPRADFLCRSIRDTVTGAFRNYLSATDIPEAFELFDRFRILCALRKGPFGAVALNSLVEQVLRQEKLIVPDKRWYAGRPVMIARNDYDLRLFNGDIGLILPDSATGYELRAFFTAQDGHLRKFHPLRLPEHETVYAMTVHKSQGSEFESLLLLLPDRDSPVLTRELIYTGITRARKSVEIWGVESVLRTALSRRIERMSGLRDALWAGGRD